MVFWINKIAKVIGLATFFIVLFIGLAKSGEFTFASILSSTAYALIGGALFWFIGIIISDILFKGIVTDIETDSDCLADGGLLQRVHTYKKSSSPDTTVHIEQ